MRPTAGKRQSRDRGPQLKRLHWFRTELLMHLKGPSLAPTPTLEHDTAVTIFSREAIEPIKVARTLSRGCDERFYAKEAVFNLTGRRKKSSKQPSASDFYRLCKCSFKTIYGNFPWKNIPGELSGKLQSKTSNINPENIFLKKVSCRRGEERPSVNCNLKDLNFLFYRVTRYPIVCAENVQSKLETRSRRFASFDRNPHIWTGTTRGKVRPGQRK